MEMYRDFPSTDTGFTVSAYHSPQEGAMYKLPIGIQSFEVMRTRGFVYVDKTETIHRLVTEGMYYFLARPRRFGKSLLVSTLRCLFEGQRELFEGLWIAEPGRWDWQPHPVVVIDFNQIALDTPEHLHQGLLYQLAQRAAESQLTLTSPSYVSQFGELLTNLHRQSGQPVVVLIDEYDKPLIEHLGKGEAGLAVARANRDILRSFFGVLKGADVADATRFVLLTGVSRFSRVSVFSALNNLNDISMHSAYAALLGYTQTELDTYFAAYLGRLAETMETTVKATTEALARYYDGYRFSRRACKVYNPFSVLAAFNHGELRNYWFETGTPTFLVKLLRERRYALPKLEGLEVDATAFSTFEIDRLTPEALLFQTGYLTIAKVEGEIYTLDYPNQEVKTSFTKALLLAIERIAPDVTSHVLRLSGYLRVGNLDAFFTAMTAIFAAIPYDIETKRDEAYFHTIFYLAMSASGGAAQSSVLTSRGRIDMVVTFPDKVYIIEFKCNQSTETALRQIHAQGYAEPYQGSGKKIVLLGINFGTETRNVEAWAMEEM
ncbi:MAG: AAA family ATPase [Chloroflexi bacterium]|nr:MAG: AAA family ATPase [Chloroflexota bacterium]